MTTFRTATRRTGITFATLLLAAFASSACADPEASGITSLYEARANAITPGLRPAIVLVHGAFADGSGWADVIRILERDGYTVTAVQNQMASLTEDIATTKRVIDAQSKDGPVVVVGHPYGGAVITGAAADNPNVTALVYVAAYAPDVGEVVTALDRNFAPSALPASLVPDAAGFLYIDRAKFREVFCGDLPAATARVLAATQRPIASAAFGEPIPRAAWRTVPTWYLVAQDDHAISPDLERFLALRMHAHTSEIRSSHVPFLSHPRTVTQVIEAAAGAQIVDATRR